MQQCDGLKAFFLLMGILRRAFSDIFIGDNAHRSRATALDLQEKCPGCARRGALCGKHKILQGNSFGLEAFQMSPERL